MSKAETKRLWKEFFVFEKELLKYLSEQKFLDGNPDDLSFEEYKFNDMVLERPPKFIHAVISLDGDEKKIEKVEQDIKELQSLFLEVSDSGKLPKRFAKLLDQPLQINLSKVPAFRSKMIGGDSDEFIQIKKYSSDTDKSTLSDETKKEIKSDIEALKDINIQAEVIDKGTGKVLRIAAQDVLREAKASVLTFRESSGMQYTARVRFDGDLQSTRMSYGLLIVPSDCPTLASLPQSRRTHRLETSKEKLELPIDVPCEIFIKEPA